MLAERRRAAQQAQLPGVSPDRIEAEEPEFHRRVNEGFRKIAADDVEHWVVVDGSVPASEVAAEVLASRPGASRHRRFPMTAAEGTARAPVLERVKGQPGAVGLLRGSLGSPVARLSFHRPTRHGPS